MRAEVQRSATGPAPRRIPSRPARRRTRQRGPELVPNLVMLGAHDRLQPIRSVLRDLHLDLRTSDTVVEGLRALDRASLGIVMVLPLPHLKPVQGARAIRRHAIGRTLPVFAVVPDAASVGTTRMLYREGASFVFEWPKEGLMLARMLTERLGVRRRPRAAAPADRELELLLRARLRTLPYRVQELKVLARDGTVQLSGRVDALWKRDTMERYVSEVPGVRAVSCHRVEVDHSGRTDAEIARSIRALLQGAATVDAETLSVSVNDGRVVLMGTVGSRSETLRLSELVGNVRGVRSISHTTTLSRGLQKRGRSLALKLQRTVDELVPGADAHVSVIGSVAVLTGGVPLLVDKRRLERALEDHDAVQRVVNKLEVTPARGSASS